MTNQKMVNNKVENTVIQPKELDNYIGKILNNRYVIRDLIGKGGMGRVYIAEDVAKGGMPVAIKILSMNLVNQQMSQRFGKEIFIGAQLGRKNKHIVRVLSYGITDESVPFYVMEYLQGKNLKTILKTQALDVSQFLDICYQICLGLQCAHEGVSLKGEIFPVLHRDIKPENIFIAEDPKVGSIVKILDFGIAKFLTDRVGITMTESFIGSLPYSSPEHMEGRKLLDVRADIYSLGVLMFEMLTGKHPFYTTTQSFGNWYQAHRFQTPPAFEDVIPNIKIPVELQQLVMNCLAKEAHERPDSVSKVINYLEVIQENLNPATASNNNSKTDDNAVQLIPVTSLSEKECWQQIWPQNKPIAPIGFPHLLQTQQGNIPTFWAMLPQDEINLFLECTNHTEFISKINVYPMILWCISIYDGTSKLTRWLSYFLDIKDKKFQDIAQKLAEIGYYHLLFFSLEEPQRCRHVMTLTLSFKQRQQIINCLENIHTSTSSLTPNQAKTILRADYEKLKPGIIRNIAAKSKKKQRVGLKATLNRFIDNLLHMLLRF
ncbi:MAG: serine/threonine-protein kinase [Nostocaceae cyanobacterium]|nr:serine/threonine-protein kinase [Nostocaceae cyanobacterium]